MKMSAIIVILFVLGLFTVSSTAQTETHWYKDSTLFIDFFFEGRIGLWRLNEPHGDPIDSSKDFTNLGFVDDYLSLVDHSFDWKKSDFDALAAFIYKYDCLVNYYGELLPITFPRDRFNNYLPQMDKPVRFWAREVLNMPSYGLSVTSIPYREVTYVGGGPAPVEPSPKETQLAAELSKCEGERANLERKLKKEKKGMKICIRLLGKTDKMIGSLN